MDENKKTQGQQGQNPKQGQQNQGQRQGSQGNQNQNPNTGNRGNMGSQERGTGKQGERNSSDISERGMDESEEPSDFNVDDDLDQSER
jgi:hypothetical protein